MGDNATASEGSKSKSSESTKSDSKDKSKSSSKSASVDRSPAVPPAKGHGEAGSGPDALGIDRMEVQRRKRTERNLGPATVDRMEESGTMDSDPSGFRAEAQSVAENVSVDRSSDDSGSGDAGNSVPIDREAEGGGTTASPGGGGPGGSGASATSDGGSSASNGGPSDLVQSVVSSGGGRLDPGVRGEMESKMGTDFSDVRVHTGPTATKAAESIDAKAFTVGNHVGFNSGVYDTSSPEGKHTIAHELAHVRQQATQARRMVQRIQEGGDLDVSDPSDPHEQEAEQVAREVMAGESVEVNPMPSGAGTVSPRVDRLLGFGSSNDSGGGGGQDVATGATGPMPADPGKLAEEVKQIKATQEQLKQQIGGGGGLSTGEGVAKAATKGAAGAPGAMAGKAVGGAIGTAAGGMIPVPGAETAGKKVGEAVGGQVGGDVAKFLADSKAEQVGKKAGDMKDSVDKLIDEKIKQRFTDEDETGSGSGQGLAQSQR